MIKPIGTKALVRLDTVHFDEGGIFIPDWVAKNNTSTATVVSVGDRINKEDLSPGDVILLPEGNRGTPIISCGVMHYMIEFKNILAIVG